MIEYRFQIEHVGTVYGDSVEYIVKDKILVIKSGEKVAGIIHPNHLKLEDSNITKFLNVIEKEYIYTIIK